MKLSPPWKLGIPKPPAPPLITKKMGLFGEKETERSKIRNAYFRGQRDMWDKFIKALYPNEDS